MRCKPIWIIFEDSCCKYPRRNWNVSYQCMVTVSGCRKFASKISHARSEVPSIILNVIIRPCKSASAEVKLPINRKTMTIFMHKCYLKVQLKCSLLFLVLSRRSVPLHPDRSIHNIGIWLEHSISWDGNQIGLSPNFLLEALNSTTEVTATCKPARPVGRYFQEAELRHC